MDVRKFRRALVFGAALIVGLATAAGVATAQARYPNQTIKIVVGFAAGGGNDIIARIIGQKLQESLGQTVIVENRPGAGGKIAAEAVMAAAPDGYTLLVGAAGAMSIIPAISVKQPYHGTKDFAPISMVAAFPLILVVQASHPAKNVKDLVAWMKANPDKSNYATSSPAFTLATELFKLKTGAPGTAIPYKSSGESLVSVLGEQSLLTIADPPPTTPLVKNGQVRALAVLATTRSDELPDVPTMTEAGVPDVNVSLWSGLFAPAHTPPDIVARLEGEVIKIMQMPDVKEKFKAMATPTVGGTAADFARVIDTETQTWAEVGRAANVKLE
ncbi:MAG TPA: tripartite tricarboxylate transporter substrate-binding protein [Xanthobacteraceae bacterium]|jgi:tripartite-type tricarboxylate transporter receptor subunit TctC|nr:tripartite tricarboxylate transporter substrate-binding protein [Xanthobacteraceae bacterium]